MTEAERRELRSDAGLTPQLVGLEGWRVEVEDERGNTERFIVGRSAGWVPCHIKVKRRDSWGGEPADSAYERVTRLYRI
jgi:hypothetical protein